MSSLKELLVFVCSGKARITFTHPCCNRIWRAAHEGGLCSDSDQILLQHNSWNRGRVAWGCFCHRTCQELTRDYSVTGWLAKTA